MWTEENWLKVHCRFNLFGSDGKHYVWPQTRERLKTEAQMRKEISERWRRKCHGLGDVFCSRV